MKPSNANGEKPFSICQERDEKTQASTQRQMLEEANFLQLPNNFLIKSLNLFRQF